MINKARYCLLLLFLVLGQNLKAQQSMTDLSPDQLYAKGLELYQLNHFAASQQVFHQYLQLKTGDYNKEAEAHYHIALTALELFQNDADFLLHQFVINYPQHPRAQYVNYFIGKHKYRERSFREAIDWLEKAAPSRLSEAERNEHALMLGYSYFKTEQYDKARQHLGTVKDKPGPNAAVATYYYGYIAYLQDDYKTALASFDKVKTDKKFSRLIPMYVIQIYLLQGDYDRVISESRAARQIEGLERPEQIDLYEAQAQYYKKDYAGAMELFNNYLRAGGGMNNAQYYQAGVANLHGGRERDALALLGRISPLNKDSFGQNVAYHQGVAYAASGDLLRASNSYEFASALTLDKDIQQLSLLEHAKVLFKNNNYTAAVEKVRVLLRFYPNGKYATEAREMLSQLLTASDNPSEAVQILEGLKERTGVLENTYQRALYEAALQEVNKKNLPAAKNYLEKASTTGTDRQIRALTWFWLGETYYNTADYWKAIQAHKNFIGLAEAKNTPYAATSFYSLGYAYYKVDNLKQAANYFNQYLAAETNKRGARYNDGRLRYADVRYLDRDFKEARRAYEAAMSGATDDEIQYAMYQIGLVAGLEQKPDELIRRMQELEKKYPTGRYADDALYAMGETYMVQQHFNDAIATFSRLNTNYPKNKFYTLAMLSIGQAYLALRKDGNAINILTRLMERYPTSPEAAQAFKSIEGSYIDRGLTDSLSHLYSTRGQTAGASRQDSVLWSSVITHIRNRDCDNIETNAKKYISHFPTGNFIVDANYYLADCALKKKARAQAIEYLNVVVGRSPNIYLERALRTSADLYYDDKNYTMSLARYQQLETRTESPQNLSVSLSGQLRSHYHLKQFDKVPDAANKVLNLGTATDEQKNEANLLMAKSYYQAQQREQALTLFTGLSSKLNTEAGAEAMYYMAEIQFEKEDLASAEATVFKLKEDFDYFDYWVVKGLILLSDILVKKGDMFQAEATLKSIVDHYDGEELRTIARQKLQAIKGGGK